MDEVVLLKLAREGDGDAFGVGCYLFDPGKARFTPAVIDVLTVDGEKIAAVTAFLTADALPPHSGAWITGAELAARFGLPATLR